jgi:hypothetical protein
MIILTKSYDYPYKILTILHFQKAKTTAVVPAVTPGGAGDEEEQEVHTHTCSKRVRD